MNENLRSEEERDQNTKVFTRREFLKLSALGLTSFGLRKPICVLARIRDDEKKPERQHIETKNAVYYPFYEYHEIGTSLEDIKKAPRLNLYFLEGTLRSDIALTETAKEHLFAGISTQDSLLTGTWKYVGRALPEETLAYLSKINALVASEDQDLPQDKIKLTNLFKVTEPFVAEGTLTMLVISKIKKVIANKKSIPLDTVKDLALIAGSAWAGLDSITEAISFLSQDTFSPESAVANAAQRIRGILGYAHPEDLLLFFRNILIARKLQFLGQHLKEKAEVKPIIGFEVGRDHIAIQDLLTLGEDFTLGLLDIYPKQLLKEIVDYNGGIDPFTKVLVMPVRQNLESDANVREIVTDKKLKKYLEDRLA